ncbi:MAG: saccharopine dehydrogenase [Benjaminiella poitrasii]|nr:MAG: saccharopine dehydrogenase [Benjaminiella poitrasii]
MSNNTNKFDITVFGGTGLTGKQIVRHIFELSVDRPEFYSSNFRWAIAGRSAERLEEVVNEFVHRYPRATIEKPAILISNVSQKEQLDAMTSQTKVLINAVGPFRFMGEHVIRSCIENGCNYVDVTGEPEFIERMQHSYQDKAVANKVAIVHACGFDSNLYTQHGWIPTQIEMFLKLHTGVAGMRGGYATFESAVHGFGSADLLREIRKASTLKRLPYPQGQKLKFHKGASCDEEFGYRVPFMFADPSVVRLSQQIFLTGLANTEKQKSDVILPPPIQFAAYLLLPSLWALLLYMFYGFIFSLLAAYPWGRNLLLEHPELFSHGLFSKEHPTETQLDQSSFEIILRSKGYDHALTPGYSVPPNRNIKVVVRGPESGYVATPRIVVQCAMAILNNKDQGYVPNGVLTPATAFWETDLIEKLRYVGITFDVSN